MNFLAQSTPLTPKKKRSSGLHASDSSLTPTADLALDRTTIQESPTTPTKASSKKASLSRTPPSTQSDRFIPNRNNIDFDLCHNRLLCHVGDENDDVASPSNSPSTPHRSSQVVTEGDNIFHSEVLKSLEQSPSKRLMSFANNHDEGMSRGSPSSPLNLKRPFNTATSPKLSSPKKKTKRILPTGPSKILDAPGLRDDYYLNLLSWGSNDVIAIALHNSVYLWHAADGHIDQLLQLEDSDNYVTSVQWAQADNTIAVGTNANTVEIWDSEKLVRTRELTGHTGRVSSLSWNNCHTLSSGGRDSAILNHDLRQSRHVQSTYLGHQQEVCGLAWSPDGSALASGGNENLLCIWDAAMSSSSGRSSSTGGSSLGGSRARVLNQSSSTPRFQMTQHQAAVKALAWCPWQRDVLASGGGTADRSIRLWNSTLGTNLCTIDTGSQVCAMQWSEPHKELVSSHGFSDNQLCLWKPSSSMNTLTKIREFKSHTARVLHMAKSPDGTKVVSAGADESLRFWDIFSPNGHCGGAVEYPLKGMAAAGMDRMNSLGGVGGMSMAGGFSLR
eukprot:CAMPEP_0114427084 /NCGR_PEP_ID=MMETSP0103-20121206/8152_1 /TAXON_ID=37642 ORGANISM="Paraphysomonas imperforata, Strain PA2" /NCGR_SAMPLE_ID=MMETSP0103 /ASSEMBLY_ACC=CAM_ASM_000201 /LENGTH=557 /DNA_ID=CAMNT_0001596107 /DNA_START=50 /DNA_END=1723 /DNA_ORIENTATION=+